MDQRQRLRIPLPNALTGEVTVYRPLTVSDLSPHGARVETPEPLRVNSVRAFRLNLGEQTVVLKGRVCHASVRALDDQRVVYTSGIEFLDVAPQPRMAIERFLERVGGVAHHRRARGDSLTPAHSPGVRKFQNFKIAELPPPTFERSGGGGEILKLPGPDLRRPKAVYRSCEGQPSAGQSPAATSP